MWFPIRNRNQLDKIIITAMDRFVWFVILVVMSHLVTEFSRVTGYARGNRQEIILVNDSIIEPKSVHNMILYPGQKEYGLYEAPPPSFSQGDQYMHLNPYNGANNLQHHQQLQAEIIVPPNNSNQGFSFSFRPLIDSIFEIPISTLRAVNNLVARLTGSYQAQSPAYSSPKSAGVIINTEQSHNDLSSSKLSATKVVQGRTSLIREEMQ